MIFRSFLCCFSHNINTVYSDDAAGGSKATIGQVRLFTYNLSCHKHVSKASTSNATSKLASPVNSSPVKTHPSLSGEPYSPQHSFSLFKSYADGDDPSVIGPEGYEKLCTDAGLPLDGALPLILAWQLGSKEMAKITKDEWTSGTGSLKLVCYIGQAMCCSLTLPKNFLPQPSSHSDP